MVRNKYYQMVIFTLALTMLAIGSVNFIRAGEEPPDVRPEYRCCTALLDTPPCAEVRAEPSAPPSLRLWKGEGVFVIQVFRASPSADWEQWTTSCFNSNQLLIAVDMQLATRYGNVFIDEHRLYDPNGAELNTHRTVRDLFTNELRDDNPDSYYYQPPETKPRLTALLDAVLGEGWMSNADSVKACLPLGCRTCGGAP